MHFLDRDPSKLVRLKYLLLVFPSFTSAQSSSQLSAVPKNPFFKVLQLQFLACAITNFCTLVLTNGEGSTIPNFSWGALKLSLSVIFWLQRPSVLEGGNLENECLNNVKENKKKIKFCLIFIMRKKISKICTAWVNVLHAVKRFACKSEGKAMLRCLFKRQ